MLKDIILKFISTKVNFPDGSSLEPLHRMALRYSEAGKTLDIGYDHVPWSKNYDLVVETIDKWNPPNEHVIITDEKVKEIFDKVVIYSRKRGHRIKII
jgi:hypothetical protein